MSSRQESLDTESNTGVSDVTGMELNTFYLSDSRGARHQDSGNIFVYVVIGVAAMAVSSAALLIINHRILLVIDDLCVSRYVCIGYIQVLPRCCSLSQRIITTGPALLRYRTTCS